MDLLLLFLVRQSLPPKNIWSLTGIQPVHQKDEFKAFCEIVDRHEVLPDTQNVYIGDRGYCSYNNMAPVLEKGQSFVFRTKDIHSKGLVSNFDFPEEYYYLGKQM